MSANPDLMEHRWGIRVDLEALVEIRTAENWAATAVVRNASLSGAFLESDSSPAPLSRVSVRLVARTGEWLEACVVRVEDTGFAVEWLDPGVQAVTALLSLRRDATVTRINRESANHSRFLQ
jgi:hypothetical protein